MVSLHSATLCYVPLPGLCTYPECNGVLDALFLRRLSPFAQFIIHNPSEILDASHPSSKVYESAPFHAIIKYKWHAFARWRFFVFLFVYYSYFALFAGAISMTTSTAVGRGLMIASMTIGSVILLSCIRFAIINVVNGTGYRFFSMPSSTLIFVVLSIPFITGFISINHVDNAALPVLQYLSIAFFWFGLMGTLLAFKNIGTFIIVIMHICRKVLWLLSFLGVLLLAFIHSIVTLIRKIPADGEGSDAFSEFNKSLKNTWFALLGSYDSLQPWESSFWVDITIIAFSFFINIIILNILIALVTTIYEEVTQRAYAEWTTIRARAIIFVEFLFMLPSERQNRNYFPSTITYEVHTENVNDWPQKLKENDASYPWEEKVTMSEEKLRQFLTKFIEFQNVTDLNDLKL